MSHAINLEGKSFGLLTVLKRDETKTYINRRYRAVWLCKCQCGNTASVRSHALRTGRTKSCGCLCVQNINGPKCSNFKGYEEIPLTLWSQIRNRATKINVGIDLSIEHLWKLFLKQNRKCALSGQDLYFGSHQSIGLTRKGNASLDRIDSNKGYVKDNVQWVHKDVNLMKQSYDQKYFLDTCKQIADTMKSNE